MAYVSPTLTLIVGAVKKAASALGRDFNELEHLQNSVRSDKGFAQHAYDKVQKILQEELSKIKAGLPIITSDKDSIPASGTYFTLCAIDGFDNFAHGHADFAVSVALIENGKVIDGVVYSPITDEMFFAEKGCGAFKEGFRNHERLRVASAKNADKVLFACNTDTRVINNVLSLTKNVRISGASALDLAYLSAGKIDAAAVSAAFIGKIAAGVLLVKEAGGYVFEIGQTDVRSENLEKTLSSGNLFATNEPLRQKIAEILAK